MTIRTFAKGALVAMLAVAVIAPSLVLAAALNVQVTSPANNVEVNVNENVSFNVTATGGSPASYGYSWTFGDGTGSNIQAPTHKYATVGTYKAKAQVTDIAGNTGDAEVTVIVSNGTEDCTPLIVETDTDKPHAVVTSITKNSATIVWTTCEAATSRVVYGTSRVTDAIANDETDSKRGYQFSEPATATSAKVTSHSVNLTGLTPNTTYYFRVLSAR